MLYLDTPQPVVDPAAPRCFRNKQSAHLMADTAEAKNGYPQDPPGEDTARGARSSSRKRIHIHFLRREGNQNVYDFACPGCGCQGELKLPAVSKGIPTDVWGPFACPAHCGAMFVQWTPHRRPAIRCVGMPVYQGARAQ